MVVSPSEPEVTPETIDACRRGDRDAFRLLYEAYKDKVYSMAVYFFHGDTATAADVTQQVFLKLLSHISQFRGDAKFSTWLYRFVVNACVDRTRRAEARATMADPATLDDLPAGGHTGRRLCRRRSQNRHPDGDCVVGAQDPHGDRPALFRRSFVRRDGKRPRVFAWNSRVAIESWSRSPRPLAGAAPRRESGEEAVMLQRHVSDRLAALADAELTPGDLSRVRAHLETCASCREAHERYRSQRSGCSVSPRIVAPPEIWMGIERALATTRPSAVSSPIERWTSGVQTWLGMRPAFVLVGLLALSTIGVLLWQNIGRNEASSNVSRLDASGGEARLPIGEWVETNALSRAMLRIGSIGTVEVAPNTRMQVLAARPDEHRLNLAYGSISAQILAPPRLFFVNTPASTVVDLGCAYTMTVDEAGVGSLQVTGGWASLEWAGRESLVPAGASCPTRPTVGPGTPSFDDASDALKRALLAFDFENGGAAALDIVLKEARVRDTLTLWHLLSRVESSDRIRVFERMVSFEALPKDVNRENVLALEPATLQRWREELAWTW